MPELSICVYASSNEKTHQSYLDCAYELGAFIGGQKHTLINGAGRTGCMGSLNEGCLSQGGTIHGVILQKFLDQDLQHKQLHTLTACDTMRERKALLAHNADAFIALPGGPGTWEELWEIAVERQIDTHSKPLWLMNVDGYYDGFVQQLTRAESDGMLYAPARELLTVVTTLEHLQDEVRAFIQR